MPWTDNRRQHVHSSGWRQQRDAQRILQRDRNRCYLCGAPATEVDHMVNLAAGGADTDANKAAICQPCHQHKTATEARQARPVERRFPEPHPGIT